MKKLVFAVLFILSYASLYAYTYGDRFLFLGGGGGISYGDAQNDHGDPGEYYSGSSPYFKSAESETSYSWNIGISGEIFMTDNIALTLSIIKEDIKVKIVSQKDNANTDAEYLFDFEFMSFPVGVHYYYNLFFLGGGFYYSIIQGQSVKVNGSSEDLQGFLAKDDYGFFIDTGINLDITDKVNFLVFARYKKGYAEIYKYHEIIEHVENIQTLTLNASVGVKF